MKKSKVPFPWLALCFPAVAIVEACFKKWMAFKVILAIGGILTPIWLLMGAVAEKKGQAAPSGVFGALWRGDWIRTEDPKKRTRLLFLARLAPPAALVGFAAFRILSDGVDLEGTLVLAAMLLSLLFAVAMEIVRDLRAETEKQTRRTDLPKPEEPPREENAEEKRLRQIKEWLEIGLSDRAEYKRLREEAEKGANRE